MTIRDIAQAAGVSVATVSRIINHKDSNISEETRARVLQVIRDHDYVPYAKLRDRLLAANNTVGITIPTLQSSFYASLLSQLQALTQQNGQSLILAITGGRFEAERAALETFQANKVDGIYFCPGSEDGLRALEALHGAEDVCAVVLDHASKNALFPPVYRDRVNSACDCTSLLLENCRRAALVLRDDCGELSERSLIMGYENALRLANVPPEQSLTVYYDRAFDQTLDTLIELDVNGLICQDTETAGAVYAAAARKHLSIPHDLSVIALEDGPLACQLSPALTAAASDAAEMARAAYEALDRQIHRRSSVFSAQAIPYTLNRRDSTGVPQNHTEKILIIGSMNMDIVLQVPHLPLSGETLVTSQLTAWPGGKGANQALGVSRLGGSASMIGCLGGDLYGRQVYERLSAAHVSMQGVTLISERPTGTAYINVCPDGSHSIAVHAGANDGVTGEYVRMHSALFQEARYCLVQTEIPFDGVTEALTLCRENHIQALLKPSPVREIPDALLEGLYMLIPNEAEMHALCPLYSSPADQARFFLGKGVQNVIVTLGAEGCLWASGNGIRRFPAQPYPCVDSTGASDIFISCLAVMLAEGKPVENAIVSANWAASYSVAHVGVQSAIPDRKLLEELIQEGTVT